MSWDYYGYTGDPQYCDHCGLDGPCTYECIIPDPADELKRQRKNMLDGDPQWEEDEDE